MEGTAVKVTDEPKQIEVAVALMLTAGVTGVFIVIVMLLLVAVAEVAQLAFEVNTHCTTAPLVSALEVNVAALVPAFTPFTFHW